LPASRQPHNKRTAKLRSLEGSGVPVHASDIAGPAAIAFRFTSLGFDDQTRDSLISGLGYKATYDLGRFRPYVQAVWNHEFAADRTVRASLTTIEAPSYEMPAVKLGRDWATATAGTTMNISDAFTGLASFTAQARQTGVTTYGGQVVGLNYKIN